jgi:hypothetical protein
MKTLFSMCLAGSLAGLIAPAALAGNWTAPRTLQGPFAVSSPPSPPKVTVNANGHTLMAWNATGVLRYAERVAGAPWQVSSAVPGATAAAGPFATALGRNEVAAMAWTTVATRYEPSKLLASVRPRGGSLSVPVLVAPGGGVFDIRAGVACDGSVTLVWNDATGVHASTLAGQPGPGACDGAPTSGPWSAPLLLSSPGVGGALPDLAINDAGAAVAVWQEGAGGNPTTISAALRAAGANWQPAATVSLASGLSTWNPKPGIDAAGNAVVGYLDGYRMVVTLHSPASGWSVPQVVSGTQSVYYPALAMSAGGDVLAAWMALDASNFGSVWQSLAPAGSGFPAAARVSARSDNADWPTAAFAPGGGLALIGWVDDNTNTARASVWSGGRWVRSVLGAGYWGSQIPVGAGGGVAAAGWAVPAPGNPNSASLLGRTWR